MKLILIRNGHCIILRFIIVWNYSNDAMFMKLGKNFLLQLSTHTVLVVNNLNEKCRGQGNGSLYLHFMN